jgi:hypothetical protein
MAEALCERFAQGLGDEDDLDSLVAIEGSEQKAFAKIEIALLIHKEKDPQENVKQYTAMLRVLLERGFRPFYAYYKYLDMHDWDDMLGFYSLLSEYHLPIPVEYLTKTVGLLRQMHLDDDGEWLLSHVRHMLNLNVSPTKFFGGRCGLSDALDFLIEAQKPSSCCSKDSLAVV